MHPLPGLPDEWYCNRKYRRKESRNVDCLSILQGNLEHFLANLLHFNNKIYIVQNTIWSYKSRPCFYLHYLFAASGVDTHRPFYLPVELTGPPALLRLDGSIIVPHMLHGNQTIPTDLFYLSVDRSSWKESWQQKTCCFTYNGYEPEGCIFSFQGSWRMSLDLLTYPTWRKNRKVVVESRNFFKNIFSGK